MDSENNKGCDYIVTFSDFKRIFKSNSQKILLFTLLFSCLGALYSLTRPIKYEVSASFKERGLAKANLETSSLNMIFGANSSPKQAEATTWMSSHNLMKELADRLDFNGIIKPKYRSLSTIAERMKENLKLEYAYLRDRKLPGVRDKTFPFYLTNVTYPGEIAKTLDLKLLDNDAYSLTDEDGTLIGTGIIGHPFTQENFSFTMHRNQGEPIKNTPYIIELIPTNDIAKALPKLIKFKSDSKDKEVVHIEAQYHDRHIGAKLVNTLMDLYKERRTQEQQRISEAQIDYLERRQTEANENLRRSMEEFAREQSQDLEDSGFLSADKALEFLAMGQQEHQRRLLTIDLEVKRLKKVLAEGYVYYDRYHIDGDPGIINNLLNEIRTLNQKGNSIKLSLQESHPNYDDTENMAFTKQMAESDDIQQLLSELIVIRNEINHDNLVVPSDELINDPRIMLKSWYEKLQEFQQEFQASQLSKNEWESRKLQFKEYLSNLIQLFEVHVKAIRQRLAHHGDLKEEFKGIDLNLAHELFLNYNRELNEVDSLILKYQWILENIEKPKFELNSLSTQLEDPISKNIITTYSKLLLKYQDVKNLSTKEQERIKDELQRQKKFLEMHISQTLQIANLTVDLLKSKTYALQKVSLALIQQQISLLEQQLGNYIDNRIQNLTHEKYVIEEHLQKLNGDISKIPQKKISEQLIQQKLEQSRDFGKEITHLVESKNISNNLEIVQSTAIDTAVVPLFPKRPMLILFTIVGALFGLTASSFYLCAKEALGGVRASENNLNELGLHVSGTLSKNFSSNNATSPLDNDLSVIRRAANQLYDPHRKCTLLLGSNRADISKHLATIGQRKGLKCIIVPFSFHEHTHKSQNGFLQFLNGTVSKPSIISEKDYDIIPTGGISRFDVELVCSKKCNSFLNELSEKYDWIIAVSNASPTSAEADTLIEKFSQIGITLTNERLQELDRIRETLKSNTQKRVTFFFSAGNS
ncbi:MAG: hypothetical protein VX777_09695 [Chlamydiota bacterium]|nr:hypothetical protein [Chlamydiota bacterium]